MSQLDEETHMNADTLNEVVDGLNRDVEHYETEKAKFLEGFESNPAYTIEWRASEMLIAQARFELAVRFLDLDGDVDHEPEEVTAEIERWCDQLIRHMDHMIRVGSRSTSATANLWEDAKNAADLELYARVRGLESREK